MQVELGFAPITNPGACPSGRVSVICCTLTRSEGRREGDRDPSSDEDLESVPMQVSLDFKDYGVFSICLLCCFSWGNHATGVLIRVPTDCLFLNHNFPLDVRDSC